MARYKIGQNVEYRYNDKWCNAKITNINPSTQRVFIINWENGVMMDCKWVDPCEVRYDRKDKIKRILSILRESDETA